MPGTGRLPDQSVHGKRIARAGSLFDGSGYGRDGVGRIQRSLPDGPSSAAREKGRISQQGVSGCRRRDHHPTLCRTPRSYPACRFGTLGNLPVPRGREHADRQDYPDGFGRTLSAQIARGDGTGRRRTGTEPSQLAHGCKGDDRFGLTDEQRFRGDRGPVVVRFTAGSDRRCNPSGVDHPLDGSISGRSDQSPDRGRRTCTCRYNMPLPSRSGCR